MVWFKDIIEIRLNRIIVGSWSKLNRKNIIKIKLSEKLKKSILGEFWVFF